MPTKSTYLPLEQFHIVKISGLHPEKVKSSAKQVRRDREDIKYSSVLNAIAKSLGVKGGFAAYERYYNEVITPFLDKHNLKRRADLFTPRKIGLDNLLKNITHQSLSERIFNAGKDLPLSVFTGYNYDYKGTIDDGHYYFQNIASMNGSLPCNLVSHFNILDFLSSKENNKNIVTSENKVIFHNLEAAKLNPNYTFKAMYGYNDRNIKDVVLGSLLLEISYGFNLLGDSLIHPKKSKNIIELYNENTENYPESIRAHSFVMDAFRERINESQEGWVQLIKLNDNLVFIKGLKGEYDFVFRNQKNSVFTHQSFDNALKIADTPYFIENYEFKRWNYFENKGCQEEDSHNAEIHYYKSGNCSSNYPGELEILINYHKAKNSFVVNKPLKKTIKYSHPISFIKLKTSNLMVSDPVTIKEFNSFISENKDYLNYRTGDCLKSINSDNDPDVPASCTWYDALAFCKWYSVRYGINVRLPSLNEYLGFRIKPIMLSESELRKDTYFEDSNRVYKDHPPYMRENDFQNLKLKFIENIELLSQKNNLKYFNTNDYAEWVIEKACVRSGNLKSFRNNDNHLKSSPPLDSTGKYKSLKIGLRLCYDT